jgi:tRNA/tmRNA/rRNA uracil-C5-methylase (TrmA/RlmC/RlmD family)
MAGKKSQTSVYRKGQEIKVHIIDIGMRGEGIGKLEDGYTVFIKDAVIGDYVRASIMKANKSYAYAHLEQILQASPHRVEPLCPIARQCGGCQLQALSYEKELEYKQSKVRADLSGSAVFLKKRSMRSWSRSSVCRIIPMVPGGIETRRRCRWDIVIQERVDRIRGADHPVRSPDMRKRIPTVKLWQASM